MNGFTRWPILDQCLKDHTLELIDLLFAESLLKKLPSDEQTHAALLAVLFASSRQGHMALDINNLKNIPDPLIKLTRAGAATFPKIEDWVCRFESYYYLPKHWACESRLLTELKRLSHASPILSLQPGKKDQRLNAKQQEAVDKGLRHCLSILTGGPGTGKTFTAAALVTACLQERKDIRIILAAPTGKAVAQLESNLRSVFDEKHSLRSGTLHSLLGIRKNRMEKTPLLADLILVDECSMIDAQVFAQLLQAVPSGARLILIGDRDQLPPVEMGSVFADLLDSGLFPATILTESLRSDRSEILQLAQNINSGNPDAIDYLELSDYPIDALWSQCHHHFPSYHSEIIDPQTLRTYLGRFSLLSCMRQGAHGVDALNRAFLQRHLCQIPVHSWWVAPILITRNDAQLDLYNGDLGFLVRKVTPDFSLKQFKLEDYAVFRDRHIAALALPAFEYSYCLSVHKSQGSEYDEVFILMPPGSEAFGREVLYTAVTRARRKVTLAAARETIVQCLSNSSRKISSLSARLKKEGAP